MLSTRYQLFFLITVCIYAMLTYTVYRFAQKEFKRTQKEKKAESVSTTQDGRRQCEKKKKNKNLKMLQVTFRAANLFFSPSIALSLSLFLSAKLPFHRRTQKQNAEHFPFSAYE